MVSTRPALQEKGGESLEVTFGGCLDLMGCMGIDETCYDLLVHPFPFVSFERFKKGDHSLWRMPAG